MRVELKSGGESREPSDKYIIVFYNTQCPKSLMVYFYIYQLTKQVVMSTLVILLSVVLNFNMSNVQKD